MAVKGTLRCKTEEDLHRWNYKRAFKKAGCNCLARNIIQDKDGEVMGQECNFC